MYEDYGVPDQSIRTWQWVVMLITVIILIVLGILLFSGSLPEETCDSYKDRTIKNVPARCFNYFNN